MIRTEAAVTESDVLTKEKINGFRPEWKQNRFVPLEVRFYRWLQTHEDWFDTHSSTVKQHSEVLG